MLYETNLGKRFARYDNAWYTITTKLCAEMKLEEVSLNCRRETCDLRIRKLDFDGSGHFASLKELSRKPID